MSTVNALGNVQFSELKDEILKILSNPRNLRVGGANFYHFFMQIDYAIITFAAIFLASVSFTLVSDDNAFGLLLAQPSLFVALIGEYSTLIRLLKSRESVPRQNILFITSVQFAAMNRDTSTVYNIIRFLLCQRSFDKIGIDRTKQI